MENLLYRLPGIQILTPTGPDRLATFYAFVFLIDPHHTGFTRDEFIAAARECGSTELESPTSMRPLHTYPIFTAPRSPVTTYRSSLIRTDMPDADRLAEQAVRLSVPAEDSPAAHAHMEAVTTGLTGALQRLSSAKVT